MSGSDCRDGGVMPVDGRAREERRLRGAVLGAKRGDRLSLRYLYLRFGPRVYRYVLAIVGDHHEAEDVTHNVFAKVIDAVGAYEPRETPFEAWILRIARNVAIDQVRARRTIPVAEMPDAEPAEEGPDGALHAALAQLPPDQREVLVMRHVVGLTPAEIAGILGRSESSIHGLHNRGRRTLKATLCDLGAAPSVPAGLGRQHTSGYPTNARAS